MGQWIGGFGMAIRKENLFLSAFRPAPGGRKPLHAVITLFPLFLIVSFGHTAGVEVTKQAGEYEIQAKLEKNPPIVGKNSIEIEIKQGGKPVTDAKVLVNYYMPPMPRMAPMNYKTDAKLKRQKYDASMNFIMAGPWYISIIVNHSGRVSTAKFNVDAQ